MLSHNNPDVDSVDQAEVVSESLENKKTDSWPHMFLFLQSLHSLSKELEILKNTSDQCSDLCSELNIKNIKLMKEIHGR